MEQLAQALLDQQGVMIVPGHLFDVPGNHFCIGQGRQNFGEALGGWMRFWPNENAL